MKEEPPEEAARTITLETVLSQIEGDYFFDYAVFTGGLREYVVRALEAQYRQSPNGLHLRAFLLNVYREEYTAYEDLGAFLDGFLLARENGEPPFLRVMTYGPGNVKLATVLSKRGIATGDQLYAALDLTSWIPVDWQNHCPDIDLVKVLRRACHFVVEDCGPGQRETGVSAFNKIKHALVLVPEGQRYSPKLPSAPAIIFATKAKDSSSKEYPVSVIAIPTDEEKLEQRLRMVHFSQFKLRMLAMLYVLRQHPRVIEERGLRADSSVFSSEGMIDVLDFMRNSSRAEWIR